jgi:hypothetical protein
MAEECSLLAAEEKGRSRRVDVDISVSTGNSIQVFVAGLMVVCFWLIVPEIEAEMMWGRITRIHDSGHAYSAAASKFLA